MRACLTVLTLTGLVVTVRSLGNEVFADDCDLVVCVEHSLPVAGEPCRLWLAGEDSLVPPKPEDVTVTVGAV